MKVSQRHALAFLPLVFGLPCKPAGAQTSPAIPPAGSQLGGWEYAEALNQRKALIVRLIGLVSSSADKSWRGEKHLAIRLLGRERAVEAVPVLTDNLMFKPDGPYFFEHISVREELYPAAVALSEIGEPAAPGMLGRIAEAPTAEERHLAAWVVLKIDGKRHAVEILKDEITDRERSKTADRSDIKEQTKKLSEAIDYLKAWKPDPVIPIAPGNARLNYEGNLYSLPSYMLS